MTALSEALALVLRDLATTRSVLPEVKDVQWSSGPGQVTAMLFGRDGSGHGVSVLEGDEFPEQAASVADQVQEWAVEELAALGRPATWPECPEHPNGHLLAPVVRDRRAVWVCPSSGVLLGEVGRLPAAAQASGSITPAHEA